MLNRMTYEPNHPRYRKRTFASRPVRSARAICAEHLPSTRVTNIRNYLFRRFCVSVTRSEEFYFRNALSNAKTKNKIQLEIKIELVKEKTMNPLT